MLLLTLLCLHGTPGSAQSSTDAQETEQALLRLSKDKWQWMAEKKVDVLSDLFHEKAVFVHMGGTMTKSQELETIRSGGIHYKEARIEKASVRIMGSTAIVLNTIRLVAVVGGNEVVNPFEVTEVYVFEKDSWKLAALSFTRLLR
ncbi:MAG: hypothetical protein AMXMBFR81_17200 [Chthonomonas sp.]